MSFGAEFLSASIGRVLDQDTIVPFVVQRGYRALTKSGDLILPFESTVPAGTVTSPPLLLVRPDTADMYVGAFSGGNSGISQAEDAFTVTGQCGFDWALVSHIGTPLQDSTNYGLEVYRSNGTVAYSSRRTHPRLRQIVQVSSASLVDQEIYVPLSGFSSRPWFVANDLPLTFSGVGEFSEFVPALMARVNASNTGMYIGWRDWADDGGAGYGTIGFRKLDSSNSDFGSYNTFFYGSNVFISLYELPNA